MEKSTTVIMAGSITLLGLVLLVQSPTSLVATSHIVAQRTPSITSIQGIKVHGAHHASTLPFALPPASAQTTALQGSPEWTQADKQAAGLQGFLQTAGVALLSFLACFTLARWRVQSTQPPMAMLSSAASSAEGSWRGAQQWSGLTKEVQTLSNTEAIMKILPHRYPFLLVDKVIEFEAGKRAVGVKNVTMNEPQFTGHFPDRPIMPGVLMIEAMAQLGGIVCLQPPVSDGTGVFFFAGINGVRWRRPVVPGDTLVMEMELVTFKEKFGIAKMTGKAYVDGQIAVSVDEFTFALAK